MSAAVPGPQLDYLFWRDELLQVMYWMIGEGLATEPTPAQLENFLGASESGITQVLGRMTEDGYVERASGGGFALTGLGLAEGKRSFSEEFAALTHQAHGECSPDCTFCHGPGADPASCPSKKVSHAAAG
ncbi:MAG: hypothetical protein NVSMB29_12670 [Candidatus Dormibacteria bacterium]